MARNSHLRCIQDPLMAEAMTIQEPLAWIKHHDLTHVRVESDCLNFCYSVSNADIDRS